MSVIWSLSSSVVHNSPWTKKVSSILLTIKIHFPWLHLFGLITNSSTQRESNEKSWRSCLDVIVIYVSAKGIPRLERKYLVLSLLSASDIDSLEFLVLIYFRLRAFIPSIPCEKRLNMEWIIWKKSRKERKNPISKKSLEKKKKITTIVEFNF